MEIPFDWQDDSLQIGNKSQSQSFPRLRKILENAWGAGEKDAQDRLLLPANTQTSSSRLAPKVRGKKAKPAKRSTKPTNSTSRNDIDCMEL
ncbi:importin subunit alpha-7-like protein [Corchorus olitorius]|uniref:Importin subunit alpha-7-like protein n=1 Tax=Corchorus olitorius TaxID=93759 RepID=A0A1R3GNY6_9ROSI|nr:importin subunit alpha-7-like protein [Corchorus olitorius]